MVYLYALVVMFVANVENTTIQYFPSNSECLEAKYKIEQRIDKDFYKLDCIVVKIN